MDGIILSGAKRIEDSAFANNNDIEVIQMPDGVQIIGQKAFWYSNLKRIIFSSQLVEIGDSAFRGSQLERVELPSKLKCIQRRAFLECTRLKEVILPEGLEEIGHNAFQWCYELEEINIPSTVRKVGKGIFEDCTELKRLSCFANFVIETDTFGKNFPKGLIGSLKDLEKNMTVAAYQKYVLVDEVWAKLDAEMQSAFFIKRNTKGSLLGYSSCIKAEDASHLGKSLLQKTEMNKTRDLDRALYNFIFLFHGYCEKEFIRELFAVLRDRKGTEKLIDRLKETYATKVLFDQEEDIQTPKLSASSSSTAKPFCYEDMDFVPEEFYVGMDDFNPRAPIGEKLNKVIISSNNQNFTIKFQSNKSMNEQLSLFTTRHYDPIRAISNMLYEEKTEMVKYFNRDQPEENRYIYVKAAARMAPEVLLKRLKFFARTVNHLQKSEVLKHIIEMMPKKKNGALVLKQTVVLAPAMITSSRFDLQVLCAKAVKDYEVEISLRAYSFRQIEEVRDFINNANAALQFIIGI